MDERVIRRLVNDSQRLSAITNIERLDQDQIRALSICKFDGVLDVRAESFKSGENIEELHRRLDDAILLLAHKQSGGFGADLAVNVCLGDLCRALGAKCG